MSEPYILSLDLALIRWSVMCEKWNNIAPSGGPLLSAFLAGWNCRCIGTSIPEDLGQFKDSFRVGWREADEFIQIEKNKAK